MQMSAFTRLSRDEVVRIHAHISHTGCQVSVIDSFKLIFSLLC